MVGWYGLLMVLGIALGAYVIHRESPLVGIPSETAMDLIFWAVLGGLIGARLLHVVVEWRVYYGLCFFPDSVLGHTTPCRGHEDCLAMQQCIEGVCHTQQDCWAALKIWQGGWTYLGGFLGGILGAWGYAKFRRLSVADAFALLVVGLPLGHAVGRVGCLVEGCCYGRHWDGLFALNHRIPVQLLEAVGNLVVFFLVLGVWRRNVAVAKGTEEDDGKGGARVAGAGSAHVFATYAMAYGVLRFVLEVFRGDDERGYLLRLDTPGLSRMLGFSEFEPLFLSTSQAISLGMMACGVALMLWLKRRGTNPKTGPQSGNRPTD